MRCVELGERMNNTSVALGQFETLHLGHRIVIDNAVKDAEEPVVFTFKRGTLKKGDDRQLLSDEKRAELFARLGVKTLCEADFGSIRELTPEQFADRVLVEILGARRVCCGFDYRFGKNASGDAETLQKLCSERNIECIVAQPVVVDGVPVSTTEIRRLLDSADIKAANRMLGRQFSYCLKVIDGQHLGRTLGTPTINQVFPDGMLCPCFGVYASYTTVEGCRFPSVTNIGVRPTVGSDVPLSETWICGYKGDLYGQEIEISLLEYLRPERRFPSIDALKNAILADGKRAEEIFKRYDRN